MQFGLSRRLFLSALLPLAAVVALMFFMQQPVAGDEVASLRDTLRTGLKCRRDLEFDFVDTVVGYVEQGKLPTDLVLKTMRWAQEKRTDIPFPYFVEALRRQAALLNVDL